MDQIVELANKNQQKAWEIIHKTDIMNIWRSIDADVHLVGSLSMGLLMKHRDIDFHIYSDPIVLSNSFAVMSELAENSSIRKIECVNWLHTVEECIEWHAYYEDEKDELWQIDMIHIQKRSRYDGYFEKMSERISTVLTDDTKRAILKLKYETPEKEKIMGVEYYQAVIRDGVRTYSEFEEWRKLHLVTGIVEWIP